MLARITLAAVILMSVVPIASAKCLTDQPLDAQGRSKDKQEALAYAMAAWQKRVASTVGQGEKFEPANAQRWQENYRQDKTTGEIIVNVSGIPCF